MTPEQLEIAGRKYCELIGVDPEKKISAPGPGLAAYFAPAWKVYADQLQHLLTQIEAIEFALTNPDKPL